MELTFVNEKKMELALLSNLSKKEKKLVLVKFTQLKFQELNSFFDK